MADILSEITPLSHSDCFYVVSRKKNCFDYPIHHHKELELNYISGAAGAQRIVGDSIETIGNEELVLIGSENLEHTWSQGSCSCIDVREITIQFRNELFSDELMSKNQFISIKDMFNKSARGISFPKEAIAKVYTQLHKLPYVEDGFEQYLMLLQILYTLSQFDYKVLASTSFAHIEKNSESRRVQKVKEYISGHYAEEVRMEDLASLVGMSSSAFSRFFKQRTGTTAIDYILDIRLGAATRALVDTTATISEICFNSGFNNVSNFNRLFKKKKGMTPREFRLMYKKHKVIV